MKIHRSASVPDVLPVTPAVLTDVSAGFPAHADAVSFHAIAGGIVPAVAHFVAGPVAVTVMSAADRGQTAVNLSSA